MEACTVISQSSHKGSVSLFLLLIYRDLNEFVPVIYTNRGASYNNGLENYSQETYSCKLDCEKIASLIQFHMQLYNCRFPRTSLEFQYWIELSIVEA